MRCRDRRWDRQITLEKEAIKATKITEEVKNNGKNMSENKVFEKPSIKNRLDEMLEERKKQDTMWISDKAS